ncbi:LysR family transcriptional regulator [Paremcibacter congregatus]|nr:LysR family transcriptional regulator [Paremcibacter congregatus]
MDILRLMKVFVAVADELGFAAAGRRLNMSPPAVTRAVSQLEDHLGVRLLNRSTRHVRPTDAGLVYCADARRIIEDVATSEASAAGVSTRPTGLLSVTAPVLFGQMFVVPTITRYLQTYPDVSVDAVFLDRVVNLLEEDLDVGVRIGELPDSSMRAIRVGSVKVVSCAAPAYLAKHGIPTRLTDLKDHFLISSKAINTTSEWRFFDNNKLQSIKVTPRLITTSNAAAIEAARAGLGITRLISYQVARCINDGTLKTVLENFEASTLPIHILHREGRLTTAKVRCFIDMLVDDLRSDKNLN